MLSVPTQGGEEELPRQSSKSPQSPKSSQSAQSRQRSCMDCLHTTKEESNTVVTVEVEGTAKQETQHIYNNTCHSCITKEKTKASLSQQKQDDEEAGVCRHASACFSCCRNSGQKMAACLSRRGRSHDEVQRGSSTCCRGMRHVLDHKTVKELEMLGSQYFFVFVNFLQQLAIVSSGALTKFPSDWLDLFSWISDFALFDVFALFALSNETALILKMVLAVFLPLGITGLIHMLIREKRAADRDDEVVAPLSFYRGCCACLFGVLAFAFLLAGTIDVPVDSPLHQGFVFSCIICAICMIYVLLRAWIVRRLIAVRENMGENWDTITESTFSSEIYVWLFLLVSIYPSIFKSALTFITLPVSSAGVAIRISGILLCLCSAMFIIGYVWWRASESRQEDNEYSKFLTALFTKGLWYFQVIILFDKTVMLLIQLIDDDVVATAIELSYMFAFTTFLTVKEPYDNSDVLSRVNSGCCGFPCLSARNVDVFSRVSNFVLLLIALLDSVKVAEGTSLGSIAIALSLLTAMAWFYLVFGVLRFHLTVKYQAELWRFRSAWAGKDESEVAELVKDRSKPFKHSEAEALTDRQCAWVVLHCPNVEVRSSSLAFERDWVAHTDEALQVFAATVKRSQTLIKLSMYTHSMTEAKARLFGSMFAENSSLENVMYVTRSQSKAKIPFQPQVHAVISVGWGELDHELEPIVVEHMANGLRANKSLEYASLESFDIPIPVRGLKDGLEDFDLSGKKLFDFHGMLVAHLIRDNCSLSALNLRGNYLCPISAQAYLESLETTKNLQEINGLKLRELTGEQPKIKIDLSERDLRDFEAVLVAGCIKNNSVLTFLNLGSNRISSEGAQALADTLKCNTSMVHLSLYENEIEFDGAVCLVEALENNKTLLHLVLAWNAVSSCTGSKTSGFERMEKALTKNTTLIFLDLSRSYMSEDSAVQWIEAMKGNKTLQLLDLSDHSWCDTPEKVEKVKAKIKSPVLRVRFWKHCRGDPNDRSSGQNGAPLFQGNGMQARYGGATSQRPQAAPQFNGGYTEQGPLQGVPFHEGSGGHTPFGGETLHCGAYEFNPGNGVQGPLQGVPSQGYYGAPPFHGGSGMQAPLVGPTLQGPYGAPQFYGGNSFHMPSCGGVFQGQYGIQSRPEQSPLFRPWGAPGYPG